MEQTLYFLIGPKGSGKTTIGTLVNTHTDIAFIRVEPIWLSLQPGENGWQKVMEVIDATFQTRPKVMIESLGAGEEFQRFYAILAQKYVTKMIRVYADLDICLARVKSRDSSNHIAVSDDKVEEYNRIAVKVSYPWDLEIDNSVPAADANILAAIRAL
jgi:hypothetical protein